ncbi:MAG TPA: sulfatase [Candidatus Methylacidiphilales bacterium]|nr:sulfatase [Candidatus Methylacidiphilales bacterium]
MKTIFLVLDTLRADYLGCYGNRWVQSPSIDRLAAGSFVFDNHWVGSLPCMPARREFMTGRYNFLERAWGPLEVFDDVLPTELRRKKIFTHITTDHFHYFEQGGGNYHTGFNTWEFHRGQEFDPWVSSVDASAFPPPAGGHLGQSHFQNRADRSRQVQEEDFSSPRTIRSAMDWLDRNAKADDWFLQVELFDPHEPFYCPKKYLDLYNDTWDGPFFDWPPYEVVKESPAAVEHIRKCYAALLTMTDHWCGRLFAKLEELQLWDDVLLVLTTDHGTMLGERNYWMKAYMPIFPEIGHIPLLIKPPGRGARTRIRHLTQTIDLMPTFLDYHGCTAPPHVIGRSLRPLVENATPAWREDVLMGYFSMGVHITDGRHLYMRHPVREDAGPLYAYTSTLHNSINGWFNRDQVARAEVGRYLGHTYNIPLYKIPYEGRVPREQPGHPSYLGRHELYALPCGPEDPPVHDPETEARFARRLAESLRQIGAPAEHLARLGLTDFARD